MNCYCQSSLSFDDCCSVFIHGQQSPRTALQLMRSRFSAYCDGSDIAIRYLVDSYHPLSKANNPIDDIAAFAKAAHFIQLDVINASDESPLPDHLQQSATVFLTDDSFSTVHFKVQFIMQDRLHVLEENSRFIRSNQKWTYLDGFLTDHPSQKLSRNDSCPCKSGKKFKHCLPHQMAGQWNSK